VRLVDRPIQAPSDAAVVASVPAQTVPVTTVAPVSPAPSTPPTPAPSTVVGGGEASAKPSPTGAVAGATATPRPRRYRVQSGDTLHSIAVRFGSSVKAIQELNGIVDPTRLRVGQILRIP
jgi:LysM repeat protein